MSRLPSLFMESKREGKQAEPLMNHTTATTSNNNNSYHVIVEDLSKHSFYGTEGYYDSKTPLFGTLNDSSSEENDDKYSSGSDSESIILDSNDINALDLGSEVAPPQGVIDFSTFMLNENDPSSVLLTRKGLTSSATTTMDHGSSHVIDKHDPDGALRNQQQLNHQSLTSHQQDPKSLHLQLPNYLSQKQSSKTTPQPSSRPNLLSSRLQMLSSATARSSHALDPSNQNNKNEQDTSSEDGFKLIALSSASSTSRSSCSNNSGRRSASPQVVKESHHTIKTNSSNHSNPTNPIMNSTHSNHINSNHINSNHINSNHSNPTHSNPTHSNPTHSLHHTFSSSSLLNEEDYICMKLLGLHKHQVTAHDLLLKLFDIFGSTEYNQGKRQHLTFRAAALAVSAMLKSHKNAQHSSLSANHDMPLPSPHHTHTTNVIMINRKIKESIGNGISKRVDRHSPQYLELVKKKVGYIPQKHLKMHQMSNPFMDSQHVMNDETFKMISVSHLNPNHHFHIGGVHSSGHSNSGHSNSGHGSGHGSTSGTISGFGTSSTSGLGMVGTSSLTSSSHPTTITTTSSSNTLVSNHPTSSNSSNTMVHGVGTTTTRDSHHHYNSPTTHTTMGISNDQQSKFNNVKKRMKYLKFKNIMYESTIFMKDTENQTLESVLGYSTKVIYENPFIDFNTCLSHLKTLSKLRFPELEKNSLETCSKTLLYPYVLNMLKRAHKLVNNFSKWITCDPNISSLFHYYRPSLFRLFNMFIEIEHSQEPLNVNSEDIFKANNTLKLDSFIAFCIRFTIIPNMVSEHESRKIFKSILREKRNNFLSTSSRSSTKHDVQAVNISEFIEVLARIAVVSNSKTSSVVPSNPISSINSGTSSSINPGTSSSINSGASSSINSTGTSSSNPGTTSIPSDQLQKCQLLLDHLEEEYYSLFGEFMSKEKQRTRLTKNIDHGIQSQFDKDTILKKKTISIAKESNLSSNSLLTQPSLDEKRRNRPSFIIQQKNVKNHRVNRKKETEMDLIQSIGEQRFHELSNQKYLDKLFQIYSRDKRNRIWTFNEYQLFMDEYHLKTILKRIQKYIQSNFRQEVLNHEEIDDDDNDAHGVTLTTTTTTTNHTFQSHTTLIDDKYLIGLFRNRSMNLQLSQINFYHLIYDIYMDKMIQSSTLNDFSLFLEQLFHRDHYLRAIENVRNRNIRTLHSLTSSHMDSSNTHRGMIGVSSLHSNYHHQGTSPLHSHHQGTLSLHSSYHQGTLHSFISKRIYRQFYVIKGSRIVSMIENRKGCIMREYLISPSSSKSHPFDDIQSTLFDLNMILLDTFIEDEILSLLTLCESFNQFLHRLILNGYDLKSKCESCSSHHHHGRSTRSSSSSSNNCSSSNNNNNNNSSSSTSTRMNSNQLSGMNSSLNSRMNSNLLSRMNSSLSLNSARMNSRGLFSSNHYDSEQPFYQQVKCLRFCKRKTLEPVGCIFDMEGQFSSLEHQPLQNEFQRSDFSLTFYDCELLSVREGDEQSDDHHQGNNNSSSSCRLRRMDHSVHASHNPSRRMDPVDSPVGMELSSEGNTSHLFHTLLQLYRESHSIDELTNGIRNLGFDIVSVRYFL
ncbi:hypothetical protein C9374_005753 [Naegleria lovaniensis]|uniref:Uncharacterized protein n=1 Tax=Naegleria lovaniensis TaxID=51637 RepID=A0AA88GJ49_NAELO|nr:uncharacterized protein C9374_005753 [Naegleria lovaniensis]KAG2381961.1 hypothetical protein C9374_005753 [Naegleria lovaniensis]